MVAAFLAVALLSTILMALPQDQVVSCAPPYAGIVTAIEGTALLLNTNGHQRQLTPQNGNGTPLQVGQQVKCATACRVQLKLCHVAEPVEIVSTRWYEINAQLKVPEPSTVESAASAAMRKYFGAVMPVRKRGAEDFILFPGRTSEDESRLAAIRPETAVFRWRPIRGPLRLSISVAQKETDTWSQAQVDGAAGHFTSQTLQEALRTLSTRRGARCRLRVQTALAEDSVEFEVLSAESEASLARELAAWDREPAVLRHLLRAYAYTERRLWLDAASEFETALKTSPRNSDLLKVAVAAQERAGNVDRANQLREELRF